MEATPKPAAAPAVMKSPMSAHEMRFVPRATVQDYRDRLYHGKPELNYKGIPYRKPKRVERMHAADRLAVMPSRPISDTDLEEAARWFHGLNGRLPRTCFYPGNGLKFGRIFNLEGLGMLSVDIIPGGDTCQEFRFE